MYRSVLLVLALLLVSGLASAASIYTDQINFEPNSSRLLQQYIFINGTADIKVILDPLFNLTAVSSGGIINGNDINWSSVSSASFNLTSPSNCTEGDVYRMPVYINNSLFSVFTFICIPDNKIVNYKGEYGHGDTNYLDMAYPYLPANKKISLFNLIRVFTYGSYLNPNEDGLNASITCTFPDYLVLTRQDNDGTSINHTSNNIIATFYWTNLFGNWFRVAPLEQEISENVIGDMYNITCTDLSYYYTTGRIHAVFTPISYEFRSTSPLNVTATADTFNEGILYSITNTEKYPIYEIEFLWKTGNGDVYKETLEEILSNETVLYEVFLDGQGNLSLDASFVPVWQRNSLKPLRYNQIYTDAFSFSNSTGSIHKVQEMVAHMPRVTLTDFPRILTGNDFKARLVLEVNGFPVNADSEPIIKLKDPNGTVILTSTMNNESTGFYNFSYSFIGIVPFGVYTAETYTTYKGTIIPRVDYFEVQSNPTKIEVEVTSRCDDEVCADIIITNEGATAYEYVYYYWTTDDQNADYDNLSVFDKGQASKLISAQDTFRVEKCLKTSLNETLHYFRAKTYYGQYSFATDSYNNGIACRHGGIGGAVGRAIEAIPRGAIPVKPSVLAFLITIFILFWLWQREKSKLREYNMRAPTNQNEHWLDKHVPIWLRGMQPKRKEVKNEKNINSVD